MSIINEALKKTQAKLQHTAPRETGLQTQAEKKEKNTWLTIAMGVIFIGFIGCGLIFLFLIFLNHKTAAPTVGPVNLENKNQTPATSREAVTISTSDSTPPSPATNGETLTLNGIMATGDEQFALINNKIFKAGDYIGNKRILSITADKVEIYENGETTTLTTK